MGIGLGSRCKSSPYAVQNSNPDPKRFRVLTEHSTTNSSGRQFLLLRVNYPDAKNFEGDKIMLYEGFRSSKQLLKATGGELDPHFARQFAAPLARFKPDDRGWTAALALIEVL
jgi:hypothetical protein